MRQKSNSTPASSETLVRNIRRATRKHHAAEEKIRIVLDGLRGETSIAELCRREGIAESIYYSWSKEFLEAGKRRLAGDTARAATTDEVKQLRREALDLKEVVAEQALERAVLFGPISCLFAVRLRMDRQCKAISIHAHRINPRRVRIIGNACKSSLT